jgi:hypothetical protein
MGKFPAAWAWPSKWPSSTKAAEIDWGYIDQLAELFPDRILAQLPATHSIRDLILQNFNGTLLRRRSDIVVRPQGNSLTC